MLAGYKFEWTSIVDIVAVLIVWALLFAFFFRKKSIKLLLFYSVIFILYIGTVVVDGLFELEIARAAITMLTFTMCVVLVVVYQSDFKIMFFDFTKSLDKGSAQEANLSDDELRYSVDEIIKACQTMSKNRTGALIVIAPTSVPSHLLETGVAMQALVSSQLLESIFNTKAPIHDGAVIIRGNRALAAGCFLPLSQTQSVAKTLGTRHRAGIGITEESDMLTVIVSEETGIISVARRGELHRFVTPDRLRDILQRTLNISQPTKRRTIER